VVRIGEDDGRTWFAADAAAETLRLTTVGLLGAMAPASISERSLKVGDELGAISSPAMWTVSPRWSGAKTHRHGAARVSGAGGACPLHCDQGLRRTRRRIADRERGCRDTFSVLVIPHT